MATETKTEQPEKDLFETEYRRDYESDKDVHKDYITNFDAYEAMLTSVVVGL